MKMRSFSNDRAATLWIRAGWTLSLLAILALGVLWQLDRMRDWETPRWEAARFEALGSSPAATRPDDELWVVAVHPPCSHCRESLRQVLATRDRQSSPIRIAALIVDTERRPAAQFVDQLGADQVWWDAQQRWRKRWGHRVYGEVLCFDGNGTLLRTLAPLSAGGSAP